MQHVLYSFKQLQRNIKVSAEECTAEMKSRERDFSVRENELQDKLDKVSRNMCFYGFIGCN